MKNYKKYIKKCRYCGKNVTNGGDICVNCRDKLPYVRKLLSMVNDMREKRDRAKKAEECSDELKQE